MITCGRKWVIALELSGGRSGRAETAAFAGKDVCEDGTVELGWVPARLQRRCPCGLWGGFRGGFCLGGGETCFSFASQASFRVTPHRLSDYSRIDETFDCRHETRGLSDTSAYRRRQGGLFCPQKQPIPARAHGMPAASCSSLALHYRLRRILPFPEKGSLEMRGVLLPVMTSADT